MSDMSESRQREDAPSKFHHRVKVVLDQGAYPSVECPFDPADESRPCWPHLENGEPFDTESGTKEGCVYVDWVGENGIDCFVNQATVTFTMGAIWRSDYFDFEFGEQVPNV